MRVVRGGSWNIEPELLRVSFRFWLDAGSRHPHRFPSCPGPSVTLCPLCFGPLPPVRLG